ncbi:hypothetical protein [Sphingobacterium multivorum]|uniref:hypothetical protein n=1 Tax=Sphingobacterium multivorum TaxID=28454 RepID=UPI0028ADF389|nr:hypothetical protein [Sphingobacterium multivorum]
MKTLFLVVLILLVLLTSCKKNEDIPPSLPSIDSIPSIDTLADYAMHRGFFDVEGKLNLSNEWIGYSRYVEAGTNFIISLYGKKDSYNIALFSSSNPSAASLISNFGNAVTKDGDTVRANFTAEKDGYIFFQNNVTKGKIMEFSSYRPSFDFEYTNYQNLNSQFETSFLNKSFVVSDWKNESLAHAPNAFVDQKGNCYLAYYGGANVYQEAYTNAKIKAKLCMFNFAKNTEVTTIPVMGSGDSFPNFTQDKAIAPYDPALFPYTKNSDEFIYLVLAKEQSRSAQSMQYVGRVFSRSKNQFINNQILECKLTYSVNGNKKTVDFSESGFIQLTNELNFNKTTYIGHPTISGHWQRFKDEYYTVIGSIATGKGNGIPGYIVKTKDGINYDFVTAVPSNNKNIWEGTILINGSNLYCILRGSSSIFKYSLESDNWTLGKTDVLTDEEQQRHCFFQKDNRFYIIYNIKKGTTINYRNYFRVLELDPSSLSVLKRADFTAPFSFQYYNVVKHNNTWWIYYVEDRRRQVIDMKGNISFLPLEELLGRLKT